MNTQEFAGYSITRSLAGGGMTKLYVALDNQQNRYVIRTLTPEHAKSRKARQRFFGGGDILRQMNHPCIVRFVAQGMEDKIPYMVVEYIESRTLRDLILYRDPLLTQNVMPLLRQMAYALQYVHAQGYLHLDFKPENLLVRADGRVVLIDFDLAIKRKRWFKKIGQVSGTSAYVPPETLTTREADDRADIYAFGVCAYEMLTFHKPFEGDKLELVRAAQIDPKIAPPRLRQHNAEVPAALEALVMKCLAKNPNDRYPDMVLVIRDLDALI